MTSSEEYRVMLDNLTATQARCTELVQAERAAKAELRQQKGVVEHLITTMQDMQSRISDLQATVEAQRIGCDCGRPHQEYCRG